MRIHVLSDLHDEFHETRPLDPIDDGKLGDLDFIISAGDIFRGSEVEHENRCRFENSCPVVKIAGNHEHYKIKRTVQENIDDLRAVCIKANEDEKVRLQEEALWRIIQSAVLHDRYALSLEDTRFLLRQLLPTGDEGLSLNRLRQIHVERFGPHNNDDPHVNEIRFLENDNVVLPTRDGEQAKIIGATLWTDFKLYESEGVDQQTAMRTAQERMNDYRLCSGFRDNGGRGFALTPEETLQYHKESVGYIVRELQKPFDGIRIVVTHHSPARGCLNPKYQEKLEDRKLSPAFGSDLSWICEDDDLSPDLWISGHGHNSFDFEIGNTRMIGNPRGYPQGGTRRENMDYDSSLVVTTEMLPRFRLKK